jgi:hypothetical protein
MMIMRAEDYGEDAARMYNAYIYKRAQELDNIQYRGKPMWVAHLWAEDYQDLKREGVRIYRPYPE